jgi:hypothetical protein
MPFSLSILRRCVLDHHDGLMAVTPADTYCLYSEVHPHRSSPSPPVQINAAASFCQLPTARSLNNSTVYHSNLSPHHGSSQARHEDR